ncbi:MAG TPA: glycoside hydrolase family 57 protein [Candidatus Eisenbacteria bacterium]|nr:glycoside hydrolase family 57 protein [Candidatus Eisenbacteria bacterium]
MPAPVSLALVWHMHQPSYRDPETGSFLLPWTRLHATKDYRDMPAILRRTPGAHVTFNLTPVLLDQLEAIARGVSDPYLDVARKPAADLGEEEREFVRRRFFDLNQDRMVAPFPRYRALREAARTRSLTEPELRDLQVWFHLAWTDPLHRHEEPLRALFAKGEGFTEEEKRALLDWGVACAGSVAAEYRALEETGQIELITSAHHHPILPLVVDTDAPRAVSAGIPLPSSRFRAPEDAEAQIRSARATHTARFEAPPRGTWPPEGAVDDATLRILADSGFRWVASDEAVLGAALAKRDGAPAAPWPAALYRPYRVETPAGSIDMVFRDRKLSDLIGFTYAHWNPRHAAEDFVARVKAAGAAAVAATSASGGAGASPLVTVILDGENCWETYEDDGVPFLTALYALLERDPGVEPLTVSEALERMPPTDTLRHVPVGSWIRQDLGIWVGHPDKNRAWDELGRARAALARAKVSKERVQEGLAAIHAAEASDWYWWYGDDHPSEHRADFDRLFRSHLARAYACAGEEAPASLRSSLREDADTAAASIATAADGTDPIAATPHVRPVLDGRVTDFFEWRDAARYLAAGGSGSMHRTSGALLEVRYGTDGTSLHVRVDLAPEARGDRTVGLALVFPGPPERRVRMALEGAGVPKWDGKARGKDAGEYAAGEIVEARIPLSRLAGKRTGEEGSTPAAERIRFQVVLERRGRPEEVAPSAGWFLLRAISQDPNLTHWSAL